jgi:hypothetical protein
MIVMLLLFWKRMAAVLPLETADRSFACLFAELTISATAHLALSFLNCSGDFRSGGDQQDERKFCP